DLRGDGVRLVTQGEGLVVLAREPQQGARAREVLAQHGQVAPLAPQGPRLLETGARGPKIANGRVGPPQVVQREGDLFSSVQLARDREGALPCLDGLGWIAEAIE